MLVPTIQAVSHEKGTTRVYIRIDKTILIVYTCIYRCKYGLSGYFYVMIWKERLMCMKTQLRAWGNSRAVRLPAKAIEKAGLTEKDDLEVVAEDGEIILFKNGNRRAESFKRAMLYCNALNGLSDIVIESDVREEAEQVCEEMGLTLQVAIGVFLQKVRRERRIPFELSLDGNTARSVEHKTLEERVEENGGKLELKTEHDWGEPRGTEMW